MGLGCFFFFIQTVQSFSVEYFGFFKICHVRSHGTGPVCSGWTLKVVWHFWKKQSSFHGAVSQASPCLSSMLGTRCIHLLALHV